MIPAAAIDFPDPSLSPRLTCVYPMIPNTTASTGSTTVHAAGIPISPSTSDATQNPFAFPAASTVVPSIVNGIPHALQLFDVIGL